MPNRPDLRPEPPSSGNLKRLLSEHENYLAPHGKRVVAVMIDSVLVSLVIKALTAIGGVFLHVAKWDFIFVILYFCCAQKVAKATIGKKLMGLELVSSEPNESPSWLSLLGRETIGKFISLISLIGYVSILWDKKHRGFHDKLFSTQVISHDPVEATSGLKMVFTTVLSLLGLCGILSYVFLFTTVPIKEYARGLGSYGIQVDGISGNLWHGFSAAHISFTNQFGQAEIEQLSIKYKDILHVFASDGIHIAAVRAGRIKGKVSSWSKFKEDLDVVFTTEELDESQEPKAFNDQQARHKQGKLQIDLVDLNHLEIGEEKQEAWVVHRICLQDIIFEESKVGISKAWVDSPYLTAGFSEFRATKGLGVELEQMQGQLKAAGFPAHLRSNVDFAFSYKGSSDGRKISGRLAALGDAIKAEMTGEMARLTVKNLQPNWYLRNRTPIHTIGASFNGPLKRLMAGGGVTGSFFLHRRRFAMISDSPLTVTGAFEAPHGSYRATVLPTPSDGAKPLKILLSAPESSIDEALARLYFDKTAINLNLQERAVINTDRGYYLLSQQRSLANIPTPAQAVPPK